MAVGTIGMTSDERMAVGTIGMTSDERMAAGVAMGNDISRPRRGASRKALSQRERVG